MATMAILMNHHPHFDELYPPFLAGYGSDTAYIPVRTIIVDGHESYWLRFEGTRADESTYHGYNFECECSFTFDPPQGEGWIRHHARRMARKPCHWKAAARTLRLTEIAHQFYEELMELRGTEFDPRNRIWLLTNTWHPTFEYALLRCMELLRATMDGERFFLPDPAFGGFWGGYFYIQTIGEIADRHEPAIWDAARRMHADKLIKLDAAIVYDWSEPKVRWGLLHTFELDGVVFTTELPDTSDTPHQWRITITAQGEPVPNPDDPEGYYYLGLSHPVDFGVDVEDSARLQEWAEHQAKTLRA